MTTAWDAIVVGAGPAGMAAATRLATGGAATLLVDEQAAPGGQIYRGIEANADRPGLRAILGDAYLHGAGLARDLRAAPVTTAFSTAVWRIDPDRRVFTRGPDGTVAVHTAKALVLATGAMERPVPMPGWTLPGVMTVGALQILLKSAELRPSGRLVLVGTGPLLYLFAAQCLEAGTGDMTIVDTADRRNLVAAAPRLLGALGGVGRDLLGKGLALLSTLRRARVRMIRGARDIRIARAGTDLVVTLTTGGGRVSLPCRLVGLHEGVIPLTHTARSVGCAHVFDAEGQAFRPVLDADGLSSVDGIYIAGDAGGIVGAGGSGRAGATPAPAFRKGPGRAGAERQRAEAARERRALARHRAIRPFLDRAYRPAEAIVRPDGDTLVCRCESVTAADVRRVAAEGCAGPNQAKAYLRVGMGPCQGRLCGPTVSALLADVQGTGMDAIGFYRVRPPIKPVTLGELASLDLPEPRQPCPRRPTSTAPTGASPSASTAGRGCRTPASPFRKRSASTSFSSWRRSMRRPPAARRTGVPSPPPSLRCGRGGKARSCRFARRAGG